jgi:protein-S-isoprenylcysteine O-methyltransferase Ste14
MRKKGTLYFATAGVLLVLTWLLYFLLLHNPDVHWLVHAGWAILAVGLIFIFLPMVVLRSKGRPKKDEDFTQTTVIVDSGIYAIVRHPLYLGWLLMYVAVIFFSQHLLIIMMGILGTVCMYLIARQEDQHLIEKFGEAYERYMQSVPAMNVLDGIIRYLRRKMGSSDPGMG